MTKRFLFIFVFLCMGMNLYGGTEKQKDYAFADDPIDVVIVSHPKDKGSLDFCIKGIRENCEVRRVIVVSSEKLTDKAEWFNEKDYPFSKDDVAFQIGREDPKKARNFFRHGHPIGWYFQQLLKLYSAFVIPDISSNVLVIDADTVFLNPVQFLDKRTHAGFLCTARKATTYTRYVRHAQRLIPNYKQKHPKINSVHHHMLFQKPILDDLFATIENHHKLPFWKAFCRCVDLSEKGASEYEIYFNYALTYSKDVKLRPLKRRSSSALNKISVFKEQGFHLVSFHSYMRK